MEDKVLRLHTKMDKSSELLPIYHQLLFLQVPLTFREIISRDDGQKSIQTTSNNNNNNYQHQHQYQ